jgi:nucleoporin NUP82
MMEIVEGLTGQRQTAFQAKLRRIQERQSNLLARFDRILQVMIAKASPELSEHETKWFEELRRMKEEVNGAGRWDEGSLVARTKMVRFTFPEILRSALTGC